MGTRVGRGLVEAQPGDRPVLVGGELDPDLDGYYREVAKRVPVGRVGEAEEFADLVAFLCSARAAYITGTAINFDGGMSAAF